MSGKLIARCVATETIPIVLPDSAAGFSWIRNATSTMFAAVGYDAANEVLRVVFRKSGRQVEYIGFNALRWHYFKRAKSLGRHWKAYILPLEGTEVK